MKRALVVMAKRPAAGQTKTRLSPPLSPVQAALLYEAFLRDTLGMANQVECEGRFVAHTPESSMGYFATLAPAFSLIPQGDGSLGERLDRVLGSCLTAGFDRAVVLGSDSPCLSPAQVDGSFRLLAEMELVLGPCEDGGYYLAGLSRPIAPFFSQITMSTPRVLVDTLELARSMGLRSAQTSAHWDVDVPEDLKRLRRELTVCPSTLALRTREFLASWGLL